MSELLGEPPHIVEERRGLNQELRVIKGAAGVLAKDIASTLSVEDTLSFSQQPAVRAPPQQQQPQRPPAAGAFAPAGSSGAFGQQQRPAGLQQPGVSGGGYAPVSTPPAPAPAPNRTQGARKGLFD